ncbi:oligosaccharide flippase family protein [Saccharospirillum alexandrii]|uniref:oligosaccharide flippase family protein n=1 Tax=Saccharospirillum alexandrii TaxID=2448477 RepID=UPI003735A88A
MLVKVKSLFKNKNSRNVIESFFSLIVLRGFQFIVPIITFPYLVRIIGIEKYGLVNFALSFGLYFSAIIQYGFSITATREIARNRNDKLLVTQIYSQTLTASLVLALLSSVIFIALVLMIDRFYEYALLYFFTLGFVIFQNIFPVWFFQGMEKMRYITLLSLGTSILYLITLLLFIRQESDYIYVPLLQLISSFITFVFAVTLIKVRFNIGFCLPNFQSVQRILVDGRDVFISQLAPNLYNNSTTFLLGIYAGNTAVGLYSAANKLVNAVVSIGYIVSNAFLPYLSRSLANHLIFQKIILVLGFVLFILVAVFSDFITLTLFGPEYPEIATYIRWLSISVFFVFCGLCFGNNFLMIANHEKTAMRISLYISLIFFVLANLIIPVIGIWGAIFTVLGARLMIALLYYLFYLKVHVEVLNND